ncbi:MAG: hypothetical protein WC485_10585 [Opitutaceae bacterium]
MFPHHVESIRRTTAHFSRQAGVKGLLLGGSLAHGFGAVHSDVDVMILVSDQEYAQRAKTGRIHFYSRELCTYPGGYVDGKYLSRSFLDQVRTRGTEPARYAFQGARVLFSRDPALPRLVREIVRYPVAEKAGRIRRFCAQFEAWFWYTGEARKRRNAYLLSTAVSKLVLFSGRMILAHNEMLYPYHKWFLRVLAAAPEKPAGLPALIREILLHPTRRNLEHYARIVRKFRAWDPGPPSWPVQFIADSEQHWLSGPPPIDDL